jgi:hypothetical protein
VRYINSSAGSSIGFCVRYRDLFLTAVREEAANDPGAVFGPLAHGGDAPDLQFGTGKCQAQGEGVVDRGADVGIDENRRIIRTNRSREHQCADKSQAFRSCDHRNSEWLKTCWEAYQEWPSELIPEA